MAGGGIFDSWLVWMHLELALGLLEEINGLFCDQYVDVTSDAASGSVAAEQLLFLSLSGLLKYENNPLVFRRLFDLAFLFWKFGTT